jgi:hypothetical protein
MRRMFQGYLYHFLFKLNGEFMISTKKSHFSLAALTVAAISTVPNVGMAATLATSPVWVDTGSYHACNAVNVSSTTTSVKSELLNNNGTILKTYTWNLAPGNGAELIGNGDNGFAWCRFTVSNSTSIRANVTVFRWLGSYYDSLALDIAR